MTEIQVAFEISSATCQQVIRILKPEYTEESIIAGLDEGILATTTWYDTEEEPSYIVEVATGEPVGVILSQEIDGEYFDYH